MPSHPWPASGGSYIRDPQSGQLRPNVPGVPEVTPEPAPADASEVPAPEPQVGKTKTRRQNKDA
ncbi:MULTISPECIES: hypothetical protein [unclassified Xanthobacter]|uniref:hypothetical protein n=1 Tax=unclassified Xanthobacter TaxID=2623496 RepID=UPI001EDCE66F|nr:MULTISPECIES: hypothetical protein [unclassified Xanthobacter]